MTVRKVKVVRVHKQDGARLVKVAYIWPCFNCHRPQRVDREIYHLLFTGQLMGFKCVECLLPPPDVAAVRAAA
jgi:hypothetical protein